MQKKTEERWGTGVVEQVSIDLKREFPDAEGFSTRNLRYMEQWYLYYTTEAANLQRPVAEIMSMSVIDERMTNLQRSVAELDETMSAYKMGEFPLPFALVSLSILNSSSLL